MPYQLITFVNACVYRDLLSLPEKRGKGRGKLIGHVEIIIRLGEGRGELIGQMEYIIKLGAVTCLPLLESIPQKWRDMGMH